MTGTRMVDDLLAPEVIADPYPYLGALREASPVHWSEAHNAWLLTRADDVVEAFGNPAFSSNRITTLLSKLTDEQRARVGPVYELMEKWMVLHDRPEHTRLRRLVTAAFQPKRVAQMHDQIRGVVDELLDDFIAEGHTGFVEHFSFPFPATVIAELMGVPTADRDRFREWSNQMALVAFTSADAGADRHQQAQKGIEALIDYFDGLIEDARANPASDSMVSAILEGDGKGNVLTKEEMTGMCALVLFAGHETTTNLLSNLVVALDRNPEQFARVREDPDAIPTAVEEILRYDGPVKLVVRHLTEDVTMRDTTMRAGDRVFLMLSGANRDPERYRDPDTFDLGREGAIPHVGFGKGIHTCLGAQLARLETRIALDRIVERLPGLRVTDEELTYARSRDSRALEEVHVAHDGGER